MSVTLRGMMSSTWNVVKYAVPLMGPVWAAQDLAKTQTVKDAAKWTADTSKKCVENVNKAANTVLDYDIEKGGQQAIKATTDAAAKGWDITCKTTDAVVDTTVAVGKAVVDQEVKRAIATKDAVVGATNYVVDGTVNTTLAVVKAADDAEKYVEKKVGDGVSYVVEGTVNTTLAAAKIVVETEQAVEKKIVDGVNYVDEGQKGIRRDIAKTISPD